MRWSIRSERSGSTRATCSSRPRPMRRILDEDPARLPPGEDRGPVEMRMAVEAVLVLAAHPDDARDAEQDVGEARDPAAGEGLEREHDVGLRADARELGESAERVERGARRARQGRSARARS
jgi:hypothetical protein